MMDLGLSGHVMLGGIMTSYAADAPVENEVQVEETSNTVILEYVVPYHMEIVDFGVVITEDFVTQATDPVVSLKTMLVQGGTETALKALTLGNSNSAGLTRGNSSTYAKDNQVAISADTDLDSGMVVHADLGTANRKLVPGQILLIEHTTAATGAGGSYVPFVLLKISGPDFTSSKVWRELRSGEAVLD